ncbi:MAG: 3-phosphoserine/phosphohydroxythreonine transaminase [Gammaproteobacteria bacterium]|nr:3-phosphoserine/phosphohydroxythreonine transaminase [Gammaproteobacteria bacterium]
MKKNTYYNFSAGPATLPLTVLQQAQAEMLNWHDTGFSIMEIGHRTELFQQLLTEIKNDLRQLVNIPSHYHVLFFAGGANTQFSAVPMNLLGDKQHADYFNTGVWSVLAMQEAKKYCQVNDVTTAVPNACYAIPDKTTWQFDPRAAYVHYTSNETITGVQFHQIPDVGSVPLVADMTSCFLSQPIDISQFGLIYAAAQKNFGQAGVTLIIVRDDVLSQALAITPATLDYQLQIKNNSCLNTPPTYAIYILGLMLQWLKQQGGLSAMEKINRRKAAKLYAAIDASDFYHNQVNPTDRSIMNVTFTLPDENLTKQFLHIAQQAGLYQLRGHKKLGGIRASIYNAMPEAGVDTLLAVMKNFERS